MNELNEFLSFISECKKEEEYPEKTILKNELLEQIFNNKNFDISFDNIITEKKEKLPESDIKYIPPEIQDIQLIEDIIPKQQEIISPEILIENDPILEYVGAIKETKEKKPLLNQEVNLKELQNKINSIENWLSNIPMMNSSGGGAGEIYNLDYPTRTVSSNTTIGRKDYYLGVNSTNQVYVTLPIQVKQGRVITIKDESGTASLNSIIIVGNVDNDPDGVELRINNGSLTLIYNNGWRII